jgi:di/tricarboxylate transporter
MVIPDIPNAHALASLVLTALALFLFTRERIPLESSSLFVLAVLIVGFELFPYSGPFGEITTADFFHGFGHEALIAVCALMVAGQALVNTGALEPVARRLGLFWRRSPSLALLATLVAGAGLSAFMNNTPIVVLMLPMLIGAAARSDFSSSGVLLPMGMATLIGGMSTTIGTSTNLLVVSVAADMGMHRFGMFDFMLPAALAGGAGLAYLWLVAPRMIPERHPPMDDASRRIYEAQLAISERSRFAGRRLAELMNKAGPDFQVSRIRRGENLFLSPLPDLVIQPGDTLLVCDTIRQLQEYQALLGATLLTDGGPESERKQGELQLAEVAVTAGSRLHRRRLDEIDWTEQYGLQLLALHNAAGVLEFGSQGLREHRLEAGDVLLVQGGGEDIRRLKVSGELLVLDGTTSLPRTRKAPLALSIMLLIVAFPAFGVLPIEVSALLGVMALIGTGCLDWRDATRALSAQVIMIIVASLALGSALMKTGGADWLAQVYLALAQGTPPWLMLASLMMLMAVVTNIISNNAAAVIGTPVAISIAMEVGLPLEPFVLAVLFGANLSFVTPMAYKTNLLVMNAGGYRFGDFVRVGTPLTLILWLVLTVILALAYGLF